MIYTGKDSTDSFPCGCLPNGKRSVDSKQAAGPLGEGRVSGSRRDPGRRGSTVLPTPPLRLVGETAKVQDAYHHICSRADVWCNLMCICIGA